MVHFPEILEAGDLRLRPMRADDLEMIADQLGLLDTSRWLAAVSVPFGRDHAEALLAFSEEPLHGVRVIESEGAVIGCLALRPSLWFWLAPEARGRGHMRGSLQKAISAHFARPAPPLTATARADNATSLALLRDLGFSISPVPRRMFFHSTGQSHACVDHVLTPEQWHYLHPPRLALESFILRPADQKDVSAIATLLQGSQPPQVENANDLWEVCDFVERYRCRSPGNGIFMIEGRFRNVCGVIVLAGGEPEMEPGFDRPENRRRFLDEFTASRGKL